MQICISTYIHIYVCMHIFVLVQCFGGTLQAPMPQHTVVSKKFECGFKGP